MRNFRIQAVLFAGIAVGCAGAQLLKGPLVPPARADGSTQRWDQMCVPHTSSSRVIVEELKVREIDEPDAWNPVIKKYGAEGWEMISVTSNGGVISMVCFKRPL